MSDETPRPDWADQTIEPATDATADQPAAVRPTPADTRWRDRRVPLLLTAAALVLGCVLGAGVVTVGALVIGDGRHGDNRTVSDRDGRGDNRSDKEGRGHHSKQPTSTPPAPSTSAPAPTAS